MESEHTPDQPDPAGEPRKGGLTRRQFLGTGAAAGAFAVLGPAGSAVAQPVPGGPHSGHGEALVLLNGNIHTMDAAGTVARAVAIRNGRFVAVGTSAPNPGPGARVVNLRGRTVIPGIIDAHDHIVLLGNRPGWHVPLEDVFSIDGVLERYAARQADVPPGEFITTIGASSFMTFPDGVVPSMSDLDQIDRPVYLRTIGAGGTTTNTLGKAWFEARGVTVQDDGRIVGGANSLALQRLREEFLTPETRKRGAFEALDYYNRFGLTTHQDVGAFHSELPSGGIASENTYTMHNPFLALNAEGRMPARLRINFLHQDSPAADPPLPTLAPRLRNSFPWFGDDWIRTQGIGEFTGGGVEGLRAIAAAGWRAEDHALSLNAFLNHVANREVVHAEIPLTDLRWILSHVPQVTEDGVNRFKAMGGGLLVGWGPIRTGTNVGPPYRMLLDNGIPLGYHADGANVTMNNPWFNFHTMITGRNLRGDHILGDQMISRQETLWLATAANKWFAREDDLGSIEVGNHADLAVLDRDFFTVPEEEIKHIQSVLTVVGGKVVHDTGALS